jgi:hypothetical protein
VTLLSYYRVGVLAVERQPLPFARAALEYAEIGSLLRIASVCPNLMMLALAASNCALAPTGVGAHLMEIRGDYGTILSTTPVEPEGIPVRLPST